MFPEATLQDILERISRRWYIVFAAMVVGGLLGWLGAQARTPVYEASAVIRVRLDDNAYAAERRVDVVTVALREDTLGWVEAIMEGLAPPNTEAHIDRFESRWLLTVRDTDPVRAAARADAWAQQSLARADELLAFARQAQSLEWQLLLWQDCLAQAESVQAFNLCAGTEFAALGEVPSALEDGWQTVRDLRQKARYVSAALQFEMLSPAEAPSRPLFFPSVWMSLLGAFLGALPGLWLAALWREAAHAP